jgi:nucleolar complex protein 2
LKKTYLTYVRNAKFNTPRSAPVIAFMANCVTELYAIDAASSYQHAFGTYMLIPSNV